MLKVESEKAFSTCYLDWVMGREVEAEKGFH